MKILERDTYLKTLKELLRDAAASQGRLVFLGGEAGVGKTVLVHTFAQMVDGLAAVAVGACDPLSTPRPLGPLLDVAGALDGEVWRLLQTAAPRDQLFRTFLTEITERTRPTLVVFEDVHWADEATFDLLRFVGRRVEGARALVIATYRDDEVGPRHPLTMVLGELATAAGVRRMLVPPLSEAAVQTLAMGHGLSAAELYRQTGGNPFFVTEVLASNARGVPPTVRDAVLARAARLSPAARATLEAAAVIGARIEPWLLSEVAGPDDAATEECLARGMLRHDGAMLGFRHELARQAILEALSPQRGARFHRAVFTSLRASPHEAADPARVAHHAEAAGDREGVLTYAVRAGRQAEALGAHREAAAQFGRALRYADSWGPMERARLLEDYAAENEQSGNLVEAIAARERAIVLWREVGDRLREGENLAWLAREIGNSGLVAQAEEASQQAIALLDTGQPGRELAVAYWIQAWLRMLNCDYGEALAWGEKAIGLSERVGNPETLVGGLYVVGSVLMVTDHEKGRSYLHRGFELALRAGLDALAARIYSNLCWRYGETFMFDLADRYLAEGISFALEHDQELRRHFMVAWQAICRLHQGRWDEAAKAATYVVSLPQTSTIARVTGLVAAGRLAARRGDPEVWPVLDEALHLAQAAASLQYLAPVHAVRAETAWLAGDPDRAAAEAQSTYDQARRRGHPWFIGELAYWQWKAGTLASVPRDASRPFRLQMEGMWEQASAEWHRLGCPYETARALSEGNNEEALRQALTEFQSLGARPMAAMVARRLREKGAHRIPRGPRPSTRTNAAGLTSREIEIVGLIAEGLRNSEIAGRMYLSARTVDHHVSSILAKLRVRSRTDVAREATRLGLLVRPDRTGP